MFITIYSIVCKTNPELVYIGSTKEYDRRKVHHQFSSHENPKKLYELIRSNGGWDNFVMTPIKQFECDTRQHGREEEQKYILEMKATMNTIKAFRTEEELDLQNKIKSKKYEEQNREKRRIKSLEYYNTHKEERLEKARAWKKENREKINAKNRENRKKNLPQ
jgi:hypothetical protein